MVNIDLQPEEREKETEKGVHAWNIAMLIIASIDALNSRARDNIMILRRWRQRQDGAMLYGGEAHVTG